MNNSFDVKSRGNLKEKQNVQKENIRDEKTPAEKFIDNL